MKNTKRLLLGLLSSVLLSTGFGQMADTLDPVTATLGREADVTTSSSGPSQFCDFVQNEGENNVN